jgi:lipopolysaccharide/colanic/teichoic acid biosynthesis glycosyltransferase
VASTIVRNNGGRTVATAAVMARGKGPVWQSCLDRIAEYEQVRTPLIQQFLDRTLAAFALLITSPIMLVLAIVIRLDSPGPALFRQNRVGRGGKLFRFTKFRTYYNDAQELFPELYNYSIPPEKLRNYRFKVPDDPRATRVGRWLRQTTLDELPNFWHVLIGDMALVGPRPEIPEFLPNYTEAELRIFTVPTGITGLAQISGRGRLTFPETVEYNLEYLNNRSFARDLRIIALTISRVLLRHGAF